MGPLLKQTTRINRRSAIRLKVTGHGRLPKVTEHGRHAKSLLPEEFYLLKEEEP